MLENLKGEIALRLKEAQEINGNFLPHRAKGRRLQEIRKELGHTQEKFAETLSCKAARIRDLEHGRLAFNTEILSAVKALGVNPAWLLKGQGVKWIPVSYQALSSISWSQVTDLCLIILMLDSNNAAKEVAADVIRDIVRLNDRPRF